MSKLKPTEVAVLLERVKQTHPSESDQLAMHIESMGTEDAMMSLVREMVEAKEKSKAAEDKTAATLASWKPIMDSVATAIDKIAKEDARRNDLEERKLRLAEKTEERAHEQRAHRTREIVVPIVTAIAGAIGAWASFTFGG